MVESLSVKQGLKRRLVGVVALIVISLAITPLLFDAAGFKERQIVNRIPPAPKPFAPVEITPTNASIEVSPIEVAPADLADTVQVSPLPEAIQKEVSKLSPQTDLTTDTPGLDLDGLPVAWGLQLASFRDERNARALQADLLKAGYKVYIRRSDSLVRVYIGPEMQRSRLETLQERIKKDYALDGMITRFSME